MHCQVLVRMRHSMGLKAKVRHTKARGQYIKISDRTGVNVERSRCGQGFGYDVTTHLWNGWGHLWFQHRIRVVYPNHFAGIMRSLMSLHCLHLDTAFYSTIRYIISSSQPIPFNNIRDRTHTHIPHRLTGLFAIFLQGPDLDII